MSQAPDVSIGFVRLTEVLRRVGLSKPKIYRLMREDNFPRPRKVGRASLWRSDELDAWIRSLPVDEVR